MLLTALTALATMCLIVSCGVHAALAGESEARLVNLVDLLPVARRQRLMADFAVTLQFEGETDAPCAVDAPGNATNATGDDPVLHANATHVNGSSCDASVVVSIHGLLWAWTDAVCFNHTAGCQVTWSCSGCRFAPAHAEPDHPVVAQATGGWARLDEDVHDQQRVATIRVELQHHMASARR
eukprot:gene45195-45003_t